MQYDFFVLHWLHLRVIQSVCVGLSDKASTQACLWVIGYTQTSGTLCSSGGSWQEGSLLSHFFLFTFPALFHHSPLEVKKVIKGSDILTALSLCFFYSQNVFVLPRFFCKHQCFPDNRQSCKGCWKSLQLVSMEERLSLTSVLNGGCFATHLIAIWLSSSSGNPAAFYLLVASQELVLPSALSHPSHRSININMLLSRQQRKSPAVLWPVHQAKSQIRRRVQTPRGGDLGQQGGWLEYVGD